jgi:hypothetical protein
MYPIDVSHKLITVFRSVQDDIRETRIECVRPYFRGNKCVRSLRKETLVFNPVDLTQADSKVGGTGFFAHLPADRVDLCLPEI